MSDRGAVIFYGVGAALAVAFVGLVAWGTIGQVRIDDAFNRAAEECLWAGERAQAGEILLARKLRPPKIHDTFFPGQYLARVLDPLRCEPAVESP
jgi:hypothetical protein